MDLLDWLATGAGALLIGAALREVFHTLLHPSGIGQLTPMVFRGVWRIAHRLGAGRVRIAGPLAVVGSIAMWALLLVCGFALVYLPHLPGRFVLSEGLDAGEQSGFLDAVHLSGVTLSTLGFGDVVPVAAWLRLVAVAEALVGFALLSAAISWVLSIYPALVRRRSLAARLGTLVAGSGDEARLVEVGSPETLRLVLHGLADQLATVRVDLVQYPTSYFFHGPSADFALSAELPRLLGALGRPDLPDDVRPAAQVVRSAVLGVGEALRDGPFGLEVEDPEAAIAAYASDHRG